MSETLITVLVPCRSEKPEYLRASLDSVFDQTIGRWRMIVIQDHGNDPDTIGVLEEFLGRGDPRMSVVPNESRQVTGALNTGMRLAKTPFVCSVHTDDMIQSTTIEILEREILAHPDVDFFHTARIQLDDDGNPRSPVLPATEHFTLEDFRQRGPVKHLLCWRLEKALAIGGMDERLGPHGADDYDFTWSMAEAGCRFQAVQDVVYLKRDHRSHFRLTTHVPMDTQVLELRKIFEKHGMAREEIEQEIDLRSRGYLRQALYLDDEDRAAKEAEGWDIRDGYRIPYEG